MATPLSLPLSSRPGRWPTEYRGRLINMRAEKDGDGYVFRRSAGLAAICTLPGQYRGALLVDGVLYVVAGTSALTVDSSGAVATLSGTVAGSGPVTMARNNRADGPDIVVVAPDVAAYVIADGAVSSYPDPDLPVPVSVTTLDGYFIFAVADGRLFASDLNSTDLQALSVVATQAQPDGLRRAVAYAGYLWAFGGTTIEVYQDAGTQYFPLSRVSVIPLGLRGRDAIAGGEYGWPGSLIFVDEAGSVQQLDDATSASRLSTPEIDRAIAATAREDLRASAYTVDGRLMWGISGPEWSWELDTDTGSWTERRSAGETRWRWWGGVMDGAGRWCGGDVMENRLLAIDGASRSEAGEPIISVIGSVPFRAFPARTVIAAAFVDITLGHGDPAGAALPATNPRLRFRYSHDGGGQWSSSLDREIGPIGRYSGPVRINRLGMTTHAGFIAEVAISDPVDFAVSGMSVEKAERSA